MFGLEDQKKKKPAPVFVFDLEKEFADPPKCRELRQKMEERIQKIKELLRDGEDQEAFQGFTLLLDGYQAFLKVMSYKATKAK